MIHEAAVAFGMQGSQNFWGKLIQKRILRVNLCSLISASIRCWSMRAGYLFQWLYDDEVYCKKKQRWRYRRLGIHLHSLMCIEFDVHRKCGHLWTQHSFSLKREASKLSLIITSQLGCINMCLHDGLKQKREFVSVRGEHSNSSTVPQMWTACQSYSYPSRP